MSHSEMVRAGYDRWSEVYDHDVNPMPALEQPIVEAALGDVRNCAVLDLGCGTGRHASWLAAAGANVTAIDFSAGMLEVARSKPGAENIRFFEHDLSQSLPFGDDFDQIVCGLVLEHLPELPKFFAEIERTLKPGGRAVVSTMHPAMFLRDSKARFTDPASGELVEPGSFDHSLGACVLAAVRAGLELVDVTEHSPDAEFASRFPRAEKYIDWPMLVVFSFSKPRDFSR